MKALTTLFALAIFCATACGQTIKTLGYNTTNGQVVANTGTNVLKFTNEDVAFTKITVGDPEDDAVVIDNISIEAAFWKYNGVARISVEESDLRDGQENIRLKWGDNTSGVDVDLLRTAGPIEFTGDNAATNAATTRTNLGLGATWLTNTNVTNFRTAIGVSPATIWAYKATNQTNATTNLVSDTALTFTAAANTKYAVELFLIIESGADLVGAKIATSNSPTVFGYWNTSDPANGGFYTTGIPATSEGTVFIADVSEPGALLHKFTVVGPTNTNAPITLEFANQSTNGVVIIGAGSYLKAEVIE
jgi:hypothetical protein